MWIGRTYGGSTATPAWSSKYVLTTAGSFAYRGGAGNCLFRGLRGREETSVRSGSRRTNTVSWLCVNRFLLVESPFPRCHGSTALAPSFFAPANDRGEAVGMLLLVLFLFDFSYFIMLFLFISTICKIHTFLPSSRSLVIA